jgi:ABC-type transport system involved in multi-copper enzyme maturation permease subunit
MSANSSLQLVNEPKWRSGFVNFLRKENGMWWGTSKWWVQSLLWFFVFNGFVILLLWIVPTMEPSSAQTPPEILSAFLPFSGALGTIGVMILMQSAIVGEKKSGTAEWIMSNPVSRISFILSKFVANAFCILTILIVLQGLIVYLQFSLHSADFLRPVPFITALSLNSLHMLFYLTLSLMLGAFFNSRGPVIGISFAVLVGQDILSQLLEPKFPWLPQIMPARLVEMAPPVILGQPIPSNIPILTVSAMSVAFIVVAIWRFSREEF